MGGGGRKIGSNKGRTKGGNGHGFSEETQPCAFQRQFHRNLLVSFQVGFSLILSSSFQMGQCPGGICKYP